MPVDAVFGALAFVGLFVAWVVAPSFIKKQRSPRAKDDARR